MASGDGGIVVTNDRKIFEKLLLFHVGRKNINYDYVDTIIE